MQILSKLNKRKIINPIENWAKDLNIHLIREDKQVENNHMK